MPRADGDNDTERAQLEAIAGGIRGGLQTMEEVAGDFVREAILQGYYRPGQRLPQDAIASLLHMSRMPVRASLRKLETEGLVVFHPYKGATVRLLSAMEIDEIYQMRILLETHLVGLAMDNLSEAALTELQSIADGIEAANGADVIWVESRVSFYDRLYAYAERPRMASLVRDLRREVGPYLRMRDEVGAPWHEHHLDILAYLRDGDLVGAKDLLAKHLGEVSQQLQGLVEDRGPRGGPAAPEQA